MSRLAIAFTFSLLFMSTSCKDGEAISAEPAGGLGAAGHGGAQPTPREMGKGCPPNLPGPRMVEVPAADGSLTYCVDSTEVSERDYAAFLDAKGDDVTGQRAFCDWNKNFSPPKIEPDIKETNDLCVLKGVFDPAHPTERPAGCVDFCDAVAYCEWAGKRLCGKIGGGNLTTRAEASDPLVSQWAGACSAGGKYRYGYGDSYVEGNCALWDGKIDTDFMPRNVGESGQCHGKNAPYSGLGNMVGNMTEWVDDCEGPGTPRPSPGGVGPTCALVGGGVHWSAKPEEQTCLTAGMTGATRGLPGIGFRCCLD